MLKNEKKWFSDAHCRRLLRPQNQSHMYMKIKSTVVCLLLGTGMAAAQSLTPTVVASSGGFATAAGGSLSYTTGEMTMVKTFTNGSNTLTQGFQQSDSAVAIGIVDPAKGADGAVALYPNPASTQVWVAFEFAAAGEVEVKLLDLLGQQLAVAYTGNYTAGKEAHAIDCRLLTAGNYLLSVAYKTSSGAAPQIITRKFQVIH